MFTVQLAVMSSWVLVCAKMELVSNVSETFCFYMSDIVVYVLTYVSVPVWCSVFSVDRSVSRNGFWQLFLTLRQICLPCWTIWVDGCHFLLFVLVVCCLFWLYVVGAVSQGFKKIRMYKHSGKLITSTLDDRGRDSLSHWVPTSLLHG